MMSYSDIITCHLLPSILLSTLLCRMINYIMYSFLNVICFSRCFIHFKLMNCSIIYMEQSRKQKNNRELS